MNNAVSVSITELRDGIRLLLDQIERQHGSTVDLDADYYWVIDHLSAYEFNSVDPPDTTIGQLSDDIASLRDILADARFAAGRSR